MATRVDSTTTVNTNIDAYMGELRAGVQGRVIAPGDAAYDDARAVQIGGIDRYPAAIVRAEHADDVARVIGFAQERDVPLAVRGGGHSLAGHGVVDGGVVLDLAALNAIEIDVAGRTAWAGAGLTTGAYTTSTAAHGLVTGFGDTASVGIGGLTLAGGAGYLVRKHGLTIDNLLAAEIVTAEGELRHVDAETHPDLFWAIRGGGGNFGVVTRFKYRLHELDTIVGGMLVLPATAESVAGFVAAADAAPDELSLIAMVMKAPPMPFIPAEHYGRPIIMGLMAWSGNIAAGEQVLAPFRSLATPIVDMIRPQRYPDLFPPDEQRMQGILHTMFVDTIDVPVAATMLEQLEAAPTPMAVAQIRVLGGAMARVPVEATAFAHRDARMMLNVAAMGGQPDQARAWVQSLAGTLQQGDDRAYTGFLADEGDARVRAGYPGATWDRLQAIKGRYDPGNLFRSNQNIPPATPTQ